MPAVKVARFDLSISLGMIRCESNFLRCANLLLLPRRENEQGTGGGGGEEGPETGRKSRVPHRISTEEGGRLCARAGDSFLISMKIMRSAISTTMPFRCFKCKSTKGKTVKAL